MHRFIIFLALVASILANGTIHAHTLGHEERQWIDAHPIVRFSIHEKYAPYLQSKQGSADAGVFHMLLEKLGNYTQQQFLPTWRKTDKEGLRQLANGEVGFIIDPPALDEEYLRFGALSEAIFWGHDAILTNTAKGIN
ncbi:hypothetical protein [Polynucleobacter necessarius]|uniref:hypothetical protein n=1 Tax=Polynucleobacter necessarius TaxID=576610 RepID=UPI000FE1D567|nr:hypothetical protein [Polynucleobacter necessarius]